jgi:hypothetical protein
MFKDWAQSLRQFIKKTHGEDLSPNVVMTNAGLAEYFSIREVFPKARTFLCAFHDLQAIFNQLNEKLPASAWMEVNEVDKNDLEQTVTMQFVREKLKYMAISEVRNNELTQRPTLYLLFLNWRIESSMSLIRIRFEKIESNGYAIRIRLNCSRIE